MSSIGFDAMPAAQGRKFGEWNFNACGAMSSIGNDAMSSMSTTQWLRRNVENTAKE